MISIKRLAGLFVIAFVGYLGFEYAPDGVRTALAFASLLVLAAWFLGYIDLKELLETKKPESEKK